MGLTGSCRMRGMNCFEDISKVDMDESTRNSETCEVSNKWITQGRDYYNNSVKQLKGLGIDMDACLESLVIEGMGEVDKQEKAEMMKEPMAAEGVSPGQDNKTTGVGGVSACTGVTTGTTVGTAAKAMATMNAKETVTAEKKKHAAAQQEVFA